MTKLHHTSKRWPKLDINVFTRSVTHVSPIPTTPPNRLKTETISNSTSRHRASARCVSRPTDPGQWRRIQISALGRWAIYQTYSPLMTCQNKSSARAAISHSRRAERPDRHNRFDSVTRATTPVQFGPPIITTRGRRTDARPPKAGRRPPRHGPGERLSRLTAAARDVRGHVPAPAAADETRRRALTLNLKSSRLNL